MLFAKIHFYEGIITLRLHFYEGIIVFLAIIICIVLEKDVHLQSKKPQKGAKIGF